MKITSNYCRLTSDGRREAIFASGIAMGLDPKTLGLICDVPGSGATAVAPLKLDDLDSAEWAVLRRHFPVASPGVASHRLAASSMGCSGRQAQLIRLTPATSLRNCRYRQDPRQPLVRDRAVGEAQCRSAGRRQAYAAAPSRVPGGGRPSPPRPGCVARNAGRGRLRSSNNFRSAAGPFSRGVGPVRRCWLPNGCLAASGLPGGCLRGNPTRARSTSVTWAALGQNMACEASQTAGNGCNAKSRSQKETSTARALFHYALLF